MNTLNFLLKCVPDQIIIINGFHGQKKVVSIFESTHIKSFSPSNACPYQLMHGAFYINR